MALLLVLSEILKVPSEEDLEMLSVCGTFESTERDLQIAGHPMSHCALCTHGACVHIHQELKVGVLPTKAF